MEANINNIDIKESHYEQKKSGDMQSPQDTLDRLMLEERERRKEIISLTKDDLLEHGTTTPERINLLNYQVVNNISAVFNERLTEGNIYKYSENKLVEFYFSLSGLKGDESFDFGLEESGHEYKDGEFYKDGEIIPQFLENGEINPKYIEALDNINFYASIEEFIGAIKFLNRGKKSDHNPESIHRGIVSGVVRIKDLMEFASHGHIPDEEFPRLLTRAIQELPSQCSDMRFYENSIGERMRFEVTKAEIDEYLTPTSGNPLITQDVYNDCLRRIEARDKKILQKREVERQTRGGLETQKQTLTTRERIIRILEGKD